MTPPPDLKDPAQIVAYRKELRGVARPLRLTGVAFALLGVALSVARALWWPAMPAAVTAAALALGAFNMVGAAMLRTLYHARRMKGESLP